MRSYKAIDLFAGIGGIRLGFQLAFGNQIEFVFSCEIDKLCRKTYYANFKELPYHDIRKYPTRGIQKFDILLAGFPCQPFSRAGKRKGFKDDYGNLFFYIRDILKEKKPSSFFLENVDNLFIHNKGRTFSIIRFILESELKYYIHFKILNSCDFGLPQNRKRMYIVGFKNNLKFKFPHNNLKKNSLEYMLEKNVGIKYFLSQKYLRTLEKHKQRHQNKGSGFGYKVLLRDDIANTLVCGGMGRERNLIIEKLPNDVHQFIRKKKNLKGIRMLTERECANLQGFPKEYKFPVPTTQAYKQIANSVPIPVVKAIASEMKKSLDDNKIMPSKRKLQLSLNNFS